jgi:hypothetical protein
MSESSTRVTNNDFASSNPQFRAACEAVGIPATRRQAGKYRTRRGLAYTSGRPSVTDLSSLTNAVLRQRCTQAGLAFKSKDVKATLVAILRGE